MTTISSPTDLVIQPRDLRFGRKEAQTRWWLGGDAFGTAWHNSLSIVFPQGEAFFIHSVRQFRDQVPAKLAAEIDAFVKQELHHTREHVAFNRQVADAGYDVETTNAELRAEFAETRKMDPVAQLMITITLEHFTAILSNQILVAEDIYAECAPEARRLWAWHAIEEIEHKGVAFDTFLAVTRDMNPFRRWALRNLVFLQVSWEFVRARTKGAIDLLAHDGITGWTAWRKLLWYQWGTPGVLRRIVPQWLAFMKPGFHPWEHDDRDQIAIAEAKFQI